LTKLNSRTPLGIVHANADGRHVERLWRLQHQLNGQRLATFDKIGLALPAESVRRMLCKIGVAARAPIRMRHKRHLALCS
jgi:hypothetical protein